MWIEDELYNKILSVMPIAVVNIAIFRHDRVLLTKRDIEPLRGYWGLPGGRIDLGETVPHAARRELFEETGIDHRCLKEVPGVFDFGVEGKQTVEIVYCGLVADDSVKIDSESSAYMWAGISQLPDPVHPVTIAEVQKAASFR